MAKRKKFNITSLATSEAKDLKRLSVQARKGWLLHDIKIPYLSYELIESEGVDRDYLVDFNEDVTEQYMNAYKRKGWNYVCSNGALHYFYAPKNNIPFYTNIEKKMELYQNKAKQFLYAFLGLALVNLIAGYGFSYFKNQATPNTAIVSFLFAVTLLLIIINVYIIYASFTFKSKANHLRKDLHATNNSKNK